MENTRASGTSSSLSSSYTGASGTSSSLSSSNSTTNWDDIFGPAGSSSSSVGILDSIFPPPATVPRRNTSHSGSARYETSGNNRMGERMNQHYLYENEPTEPTYLSSSIYYGSRENDVPRSKCNEPHKFPHQSKKDGDHEDEGASRGDWWKGSLYY